jgi:diguanylate cyclase (GGDEF)-like protein
MKKTTIARAFWAPYMLRQDTEHIQVLLRALLLVIIMFAYWISLALEIVESNGLESVFFTTGIVHLVISIIWFFHLRNDVSSANHRILWIVADAIIFSCLSVSSGIASIPFMFIFMLIVLDNGFRYGKKYALLSAIVVILGLTVNIILNPFFDTHLTLGTGVLFAILMLGAYTGILAKSLIDITNNLSLMATRDALTNLPNRRLFMEHLTRAMNTSEREDTYCACIFIDLDGFKFVNDNLGHGIGDLLLIEVSKQITHNLRDTDLVARFGGDEFAIAAQCFSVPTDAVIVANRVLQGINEITLIDSHPVSISASMGIAWFKKTDNNITDPDILIDYADKAMYAAKKAGKRCVMVVDQDGIISSSDNFLHNKNEF